jgi:hypothetical protein
MGLAQHYIDADAALGSRVGFVMFGGTHARDYQDLGCERGQRVLIPGEFLRPSVVSLRSQVEGDQGLWDGTDARTRKFDEGNDYQYESLSRDTAGIADEWMKILGVDRKALPVLCVLIKGADTAVIPLAPNLDVHLVLRIFGRLADIAQRESQHLLAISFDAEQRVKRAEEFARKIGELRESLTLQLEAMCNRFKATNEQRELVVHFLATATYTQEAVERLFADCSFATRHENFSENSTVKGVRNRVKQIAQATIDFEANFLSTTMITSLSDGVRDLHARRAETAQLVKQLRIDGLDAKEVDKHSVGKFFDTTAARANQIATLLEKLGKLSAWAKGAGFLGNFIK